MGQIYGAKPKQEQLLCVCTRKVCGPGGTFPSGMQWKSAGDGVHLDRDSTAWGNKSCHTFSLLLPASRGKDLRISLAFLGITGNHTACLSPRGRNDTRFPGNMNRYVETCEVGPHESNSTSLNVPWADLWWCCGKRMLHSTLPPALGRYLWHCLWRMKNLAR